jgi:type IV pilus assembly protein PilM
MKMIPLLSKFSDKKADSFVSINLGNYYIKGLVVHSGKVLDYFIKEKQDLSKTIKEIWQGKTINTDRVKIAVKNPASLVRYFSFPKVDRKKMRDALFYELNKYIPFSPEEVYFDFAVLEEISPSELFILLAAAKKEFIQEILDVFEKEKLKVLEINLDSICLVNFFLNTYKESAGTNACILDMGYSFSTLTILKKTVPFITRDLGFGTKDIFQIISHTKNLSFPDIEKWLISSESHNEFLELAQDSILGLCKEIKSSFDYFEVNKGERIEKVFLTGGLAGVKALDSIFKDYLDIEVGTFNNLKDLDISFSDERFNTFKNSFVVALGLLL